MSLELSVLLVTFIKERPRSEMSSMCFFWGWSHLLSWPVSWSCGGRDVLESLHRYSLSHWNIPQHNFLSQCKPWQPQLVVSHYMWAILTSYKYNYVHALWFLWLGALPWILATWDVNLRLDNIVTSSCALNVWMRNSLPTLNTCWLEGVWLVFWLGLCHYLQLVAYVLACHLVSNHNLRYYQWSSSHYFIIPMHANYSGTTTRIILCWCVVRFNSILFITRRPSICQ